MVIKAAEVSAHADLNHLSDEDYLVARSKLLRKSDPPGAKAWMVTAKSMFPRNVSIQFEAYLMEKEEGKVAEAARYLNDLFHSFSQVEAAAAAQVREELVRVVSALQSEEKSPEETLLSSIYDRLPRDTQQEVLLDSASKAADPLSYARLLLLALDRFPKLVPTHGPDFLRRVLSSCRAASSAADPLLKQLVGEVFPTLLANSKLKTDVDVLDDVLQLTIQYCCAHLSGAITGVVSAKCPWGTIFTYMEEVGLRMGWSLTEDLREVASDNLWQRIQSFGQRQQQGGSNKDRQGELFFVSMLLFLRSLSEYHEVEGGETVLVEAFVTHLQEAGGAGSQQSSQAKRRRTTATDDDRLPVVTHGDEQASKLIEAFLRAYRYYDLLRSDPGLEARMQQFRSHTHFFHSFQSDMALYQGNFREALQILNALQQPQSVSERCRHYVKIATIQFCLDKHHIAADYLLQAVTCLPADSRGVVAADTKGATLKQATASSKGRHVHFLPFTRQHVLTYCARILIYVLKDSNTLRMQENDLTLGHVIVLLQYIHPEEIDLFYLLLNRIRNKESFTYPVFCNYVIHVEFLEEFSALLNDPGCKVVLDITPVTSAAAAISQRRMGTRGANRGEKEETRGALKRQVLRSHENLDDILVDFLTRNKDAILSCLA